MDLLHILYFVIVWNFQDLSNKPEQKVSIFVQNDGKFKIILGRGIFANEIMIYKVSSRF